MLRLFVALSLPENVTERLTLMQAGVPGARWVEPHNMHITLRFIGEVDEGAAEDIDEALAWIEAPAFDLELSGVGQFGEGRKARSLWAGVVPSRALTHLQERVESAVVRAGQPSEGRKFTPHVTLARLKQADAGRLQAFVEGNNLFRSEAIPIEQFTLFESRQGKGGPVYVPLADYPLGEG